MLLSAVENVVSCGMCGHSNRSANLGWNPSGRNEPALSRGQSASGIGSGDPRQDRHTGTVAQDMVVGVECAAVRADADGFDRDVRRQVCGEFLSFHCSGNQNQDFRSGQQRLQVQDVD